MGPRLLDTTLRDGSYCVDFQFTAADTAVIVGMLDAANVGFIELGHGSGSFNHKAPPHFRSRTRQAASDEEYFAVARKCAPRTKLGIITGAFGTDDLTVVADHGLDFVRLAVMADEALDRPNLAMVERAKALGLTFSVNVMQTTAFTPARIAEIANEFASAGADWFYIVDSSGGLLPGAVTEYVARVRDACDLTIGFHAHHNSGLALANCIAAIDAGATMVDSTLQGLGRDIGNTPTEQLLLLLQRLGHERAIDVEQLCHAGDLVRGLLLDKGHDPTYFASGIAEVHSSNVKPLVELAKSRGLGPRSFLGAIAKGETKLIGVGIKTFPEDVIGPALANATPLAAAVASDAMVEVVADSIERASGSAVPVLADVLFARAAKLHKTSVLHLVPEELFPFTGPLPWELDRWCGVTVAVDARSTIDFGDRRPEVVICDPAVRVPSAHVEPFLPIVVESTVMLASVCESPVWIVCADASLATAVSARVDERVRVVPPAVVAQVPAGSTLIVCGYKAVPPEILALASHGVRLLRPALATTIATRIAAVLDIRARLAGKAGDTVVDPLFVPAPGQVVVDDPACPSNVVDEPGPDAARRAATVRTDALVNGRGRL